MCLLTSCCAGDKRPREIDETENDEEEGVGSSSDAKKVKTED